MAFNGKTETLARVAEVPIRDYGDEHTKLVVSVDRYTAKDGHECNYLHLRVVECTVNGRERSTSRGLTIRAVNMRHFVDAVKRADKLLATVCENSKIRREIAESTQVQKEQTEE